MRGRLRLKVNGDEESLLLGTAKMIERTIKGVAGDLYDPYSKAHHLALEQLKGVLDASGFKVHKKRASEATLRVYIEEGRNKYPLLNPRFELWSESSGVAESSDCLFFDLLSKKGTDGVLDLDQALSTFPSTSECRFVPEGKDGRTYHDHGFFVLPLSFNGKPGEECIDFASLKGGLVQIHDFLTKIT
jgi:hypothetical protein